MNTINSVLNISSSENKAVEVEVLSPTRGSDQTSDQISDSVGKMLLSTLDNIATTSPEKLDRISTISIKTRYRFEVVPEDMEIVISLKS